MIHPERTRAMNARAERAGEYVLYWMQASQRAQCNHALEYAVRRADELRKPVLVCFGLTGRYPGANARHYGFMLEGLRETATALAERGIGFAMRSGDPEGVAVEAARRACLLVMDAGYLRHQREWRRRAAERVGFAAVQVESDLVVPVETASPKEEYMAASFRPRQRRALERFMVPLRERAPKVRWRGGLPEGLDLADVEKLLARLKVDRSVAPVAERRGGTAEAMRRLREFLARGLARFAEERNDPNADAVSRMSPYLHFGQISPLTIALAVREAGGAGAEAYLEELLVRRELSANFVWYNGAYDRYEGLPEWCRKSLAARAGDPRPYLYSGEQLDRAETHDPYWNAAQREMVRTGAMHGYMRMYWGKKILEWTRTPEEAFGIALRLNDRYELDGRDPNGHAGVAWCFGKHDRPWTGRPVFGNVRYMNDAGLRRKFDAAAYARRFGAGG
jgi:deoxyribodipyrimidine photo-lyase